MDNILVTYSVNQGGYKMLFGTCIAPLGTIQNLDKLYKLQNLLSMTQLFFFKVKVFSMHSFLSPLLKEVNEGLV